MKRFFQPRWWNPLFWILFLFASVLVIITDGWISYRSEIKGFWKDLVNKKYSI